MNDKDMSNEKVDNKSTKITMNETEGLILTAKDIEGSSTVRMYDSSVYLSVQKDTGSLKQAIEELNNAKNELINNIFNSSRAISITITKIDEAIMWLEKELKEGKNKGEHVE